MEPAGVLVSVKVMGETQDTIMSTMVEYPFPISRMADIGQLEKAVADKIGHKYIQVLSFSRLEAEN